MSRHKRPEPLITKAKITATIAGLASLLVTIGILPPALGTQINGTTEAVVAAVSSVGAIVPVLVHALSARKDVTPVADPRNDAGDRLVPKQADDPTVDVLSVADDAVEALAAADAIHPAESAA